jgi:hypothetical protein
MAKKVSARVSVPKNVQDLLELAGKIYEKHLADGAGSPLNALQDNNWTVEGPKIAFSLQKHFEAEELRRKMELAYSERDANMEGIGDVVSASRDMLKSIFYSNPKKLGDWGFDTAESAKAVKKTNGTA